MWCLFPLFSAYNFVCLITPTIHTRCSAHQMYNLIISTFGKEYRFWSFLLSSGSQAVDWTVCWCHTDVAGGSSLLWYDALSLKCLTLKVEAPCFFLKHKETFAHWHGIASQKTWVFAVGFSSWQRQMMFPFSKTSIQVLEPTYCCVFSGYQQFSPSGKVAGACTCMYCWG